MYRAMFTGAGVLSVSSLLLVDSAAKGMVLLLVAAIVAMILRRDSAATRHLVWLSAMVAVLAVPACSALLPQWRVLPEWARIAPEPVANSAPHSITKPVVGNAEAVPNADPLDRERPTATENQPLAESPDSRPALVAPAIIPELAAQSLTWLNALPFVWALGFCLLVLRLMAARWMLWNMERRATVVWTSDQGANGTEDSIVTALKDACRKLAIHRHVTLLFHPAKRIPVVWGILRCRLMLPTTAKEWDGEKLRSVLLHEIAHIKRGDTLAQLLTQIACALHWFNPLVWFAAWRLSVERERACDDLVLASGVRPSTYAGHLLEIATTLTPSSGSQSCGLAMARKSSLEGRLMGVLSERRNRRGVSVAIAAVALANTVAIAVPIAMLRGADEPWLPPHTLHIGTNDFSTYCVQDGTNAAFVIAFRGDFNSSSDNTSNAEARTWHNAATLTLKTKTQQKEIVFRREHTETAKLNLAGQDYDLAKGRVFLISDDGESIRQLAMYPPAIRERADVYTLATQIAANLTQDSHTPKESAKLQPGTEERLRWGEPVNGLRAAIVIRPAPDDSKAANMPELYFAVQNVTKSPIHLSDANVPPNVSFRMLYLKIDGKTKAGFGAREPGLGNLTLQPREVTLLLMFLRGSKSPEGHTTGSVIAEGTLKDTHQTMIAHMQIDQAPAGAWTGKLVTAETTGAVAAGQLEPKEKKALPLLKKWRDGARLNGKIPGGAIGSLARAATKFVKFNPSDERAPKLAELLKRMDTSRDWTEAEAIALLDDVTAVYASLPQWAEDAPRFSLGGSVQTGRRLPAELEKAPWGDAQANGLRVAWLLDPRAEQHRLGTPLKSRILFHNGGKETIVFRALTWNQPGPHKSRDSKGVEIQITSTSWTTLARTIACRLAPGEYTEVIGAGIGVGENKDDEDWRGTRVGSWIHANEGDEVTFLPALVSASGDDARSDGDTGWWLGFIKDRLSLDAPVPAGAGEREHLLNRAVRDLFGDPPTKEEIAAFVADRAPESLDSLAKRLAQRPGFVPFTGFVQSGPTRFQILAVDPDAAKKPRTANNPGTYSLGQHILLVVSRRPVGERIVNEAKIEFLAPDSAKLPPGKPHEVKLPDGYNSWAAAWMRGGTVLWVGQKSGIRSYDFSNPAQAKETAIEGPADLATVPQSILDALRAALNVPDEPRPAAATPKKTSP